jgi:hypothetical protein
MTSLDNKGDVTDFDQLLEINVASCVAISVDALLVIFDRERVIDAATLAVAILAAFVSARVFGEDAASELGPNVPDVNILGCMTVLGMDADTTSLVG